MKQFLKGVLLASCLLMLHGCVYQRDVVSLSNATAPAVADTTATAVKIGTVEDDRVFIVKPKDAQQPSLKDNDVTNKALTIRAFARKRTGYGGAGGDLLLPEGDTVSAHVSAALAKGFTQAGYRVLKSGDAGYDQATPVNAKVKRFWSYMEVGAFVLTAHCNAEIDLDSTLPALTPAKTVTGEAKEGSAIILDSVYIKATQMCLDDLSTKTGNMLRGIK